MKSSNIGGQAVMEGIMMRHKDVYSIAVRKPDKEIEVKVEDYKSVMKNKKILSLPIIRGVFSFIDSLVIGTKCLMYSASFFEEEEEEKAKKEVQTLCTSFLFLFRKELSYFLSFSMPNSSTSKIKVENGLI